MSDDDVPLSLLFSKKKSSQGSFQKRKKLKRDHSSESSADLEQTKTKAAKNKKSGHKPKCDQSESSESSVEFIPFKKRKNIAENDEKMDDSRLKDDDNGEQNESTINVDKSAKEALFCSEKVDDDLANIGGVNENKPKKEGTEIELKTDPLLFSDSDNKKEPTKTEPPKKKILLSDDSDVDDTSEESKIKIDSNVKVTRKVKKRIVPKKQQKASSKVKVKDKSILDGTNWVNRYAAEKRRLAIRKGAFREDAFEFTGDTLTIWSLNDFFETELWRDDAVQRSKKRREKGKLNDNGHKKKVGDVRRFHQLLDKHVNGEKDGS